MISQELKADVKEKIHTTNEESQFIIRVFITTMDSFFHGKEIHSLERTVWNRVLPLVTLLVQSSCGLFAHAL